MNSVEYDRMAEREQTYWWHVGRLKILDSYVGRYCSDRSNVKLLNVGCGTGGTLPMLEKYGTVDNVDTAAAAIKYMKRRGYTRVTKVDGSKLPFRPASYDIVAAFDVLEHISDDVDALREWSRVLKPGGRILLSVPAYQWLWSMHDVSLHHKRRYTRSRLQKTAQTAGLELVRGSYAIVAPLPFIVLFRLLRSFSKKKVTAETSYVSVPRFLNQFAVGLLSIEAWLHTYIRFPLGTSLVVVLKRHD